MGSSFRNHDAMERTRQTEKNQNRKQEKPRVDCKLAQNYIENNSSI